MYFYHKVMSDVLSVNEKYRKVWCVRGREEVNTHTHTERHTHFTFQKVFFSLWPAVSCPAVIRIMVLAPRPGETDLPFPPGR